DAVRSTLGPRGMDKMLVDSLGDVVITNDGVTILKEIDIEHPAAKMLVEVAKTQDEEAGDGTTTAVILAGELLKKAEDLIDQNIHPTVIAAGYRQASEKAREVLEKVASKISIKDLDILKKVGMTSMSSKSASGHKELLADIVRKSGATVIFCQKGIDDLAQHYLAKQEIYAVRRVKKSDMEKLAKATGGKVVTKLDELSKDDLGFAKQVYEKKIGDDEMTFVTGCKNPKAVSILLRGGTEHVVDELERSLE